jgi:hypothetical protein
MISRTRARAAHLREQANDEELYADYLETLDPTSTARLSDYPIE